MNFALISKIAAAVLGVAIIGTTVGFILPAPTGTPTIWVDQPVANAILATGTTTIAVHASERNVAQFRFVIRRDGTTVKVLNDTSVTVEKPDKSQGWGQLSSGAVEWQSIPGNYTIEPRYLAGGAWVTGTTVAVTVMDNPPPDGAAPTTAPTTQPQSPTAEPTEDPTAAPTTAPTTPPATIPTPSSTPAPPQMPTGSIQRITTLDPHQNSYNVYGIRPEFVDVDVQVRSSTTGPWSSWGSLGCGDLAPEIWSTPENPSFTCQVTNHIWGWSTAGRQAQVRAVITNIDDPTLVYTTNSISWSIQADIG